jgi:prepilin-type N-terminal cleavage/methylation domain-containing protein
MWDRFGGARVLWVRRGKRGEIAGGPSRSDVEWALEGGRARAGFSLIEVIVALMVLTIGLLGLAAGTGWMIRTVHYGELQTARSAALQSAVEMVRAAEFDEMTTGSATFGDHTVSWTVGAPDSRNQSRPVRFILVGPGRVAGSAGGMPSVSSAVADTFDFRLLRRD